jgi:hypothetical protein
MISPSVTPMEHGKALRERHMWQEIAAGSTKTSISAGAPLSREPQMRCAVDLNVVEERRSNITRPEMDIS